MDEQNGIQRLYIVKVPSSPVKVQKEEFEKQYQLMNRERIFINEELAQQKGEEHQINQKLMWFSYLDNQIKWWMSEIEDLEPCNQDKVNLGLPTNSVPRTTGFLCLTRNDAQTLVRPDRKRCQKRLMKKGNMNIEYLQQVQEEHLSLKNSSGIPSGGTEELNDMIESIVQRIQHGNKKRADEIKMYQQISNFKETKEIFLAREPDPQIHRWYTRELTSKRDIDLKRSLQHRLNIRLDKIESLKREQIGRVARVRRLKAELEHVRKNISYINKKLEIVNSKRAEAYKYAYELGEQKKELNSSYNEYQSFKTYVKELARKGDVSELKYVCDKQVDGFMRQWNDNNEFREDYEKRKLVVANEFWEDYEKRQYGDI